MTNKIGTGGIDTRAGHVGSERTIQRAKDSAQPASVASQPATEEAAQGVRITDSARQLAALEAAIRQLPEVDAAKVARVRAAIADGTYQVSPNRIADKLLQTEQDLK